MSRVAVGIPVDMGRASSFEGVATDDANSSGVTWGAVIAGAFVAAALSLALLALGTGIGLSSVSPWSNAGASASAVTWTAIVWLVLIQIIAFSIGGYLTGRLRTKWVNVHAHEVYFRDTAHGFLVWAVSLMITAAFLAAAVIGGAARAGATAAEVSPATPSRAIQNGYFVDTLLRSNNPTPAQDDSPMRGEIGVILTNGLRQGTMPQADKTYLAQIVSAKTGISESDAEKRVDDIFAQAQQAADTARKAAAHSMYWTFLTLLVGAFCATLAATVGGKQRDEVPTV